MKFSIAVMAHPSREKYFEYIREKLGDVPFSIDRGLGIWDTCKRAWLAYDPEAEYHIVMQDDLIIGRDFLRKAEEVVKEDVVYNFFMGCRRRFAEEVEQARKSGAKFLIKNNIHHEACMGIKTKRIKEMIEFCDARKPKNDKVINVYVREKKLKVYFTMPSLVNHRNEPSLHNLNRGSYPRGARWFIGE